MSFAVLLIVSSLVGQPADARVAWLREHTAQIRSIAPDDDAFDDLEPIGRAIGDARVVLLGEAAHGDGSTMLAKTRLVKYLHEKRGFDVLIWESGFFDCERVADALKAGNPARDAFKLGVMSLWSDCRQCDPIMAYVAASQRTDRPIILAGFSLYAMDSDALFDDVISFFDGTSPDALAALQSLKESARAAANKPRPKSAVDVPELARVRSLLEKLQHGEFRDGHDRDAVLKMRGTLENLIAYVEMLNHPLSLGGADENPIGELEGRLVLLNEKERFPDRKLIVWAHSGHLMRSASQIEEPEPRFKTSETVAAGQHVWDALGEQVYSIAFIASGGQSSTAWWNAPQPLPEPADGSIEDLLHRTQRPFAFVDLRGLRKDHWLRGGLVASPIAHFAMRADWSQVFDGLFFIDRMEPARGID